MSNYIGRQSPPMRLPQRSGPISREESAKRIMREGFSYEEALKIADDSLRRVWRLQEKGFARRREQAGWDDI